MSEADIKEKKTAINALLTNASSSQILISASMAKKRKRGETKPETHDLQGTSTPFKRRSYVKRIVNSGAVAWWEPRHDWSQLIQIPQPFTEIKSVPVRYLEEPTRRQYKKLNYTDYTSFVASQAYLSKNNLPFFFSLVLTPELPRDRIPPEPHWLLNDEGEIDYGINGYALRDFSDILPRRISRDVEMFRVHYWMTLNPRITWGDIIDRFAFPTKDNLSHCPDANIASTPLGNERRETATLNKALNLWKEKHRIVNPYTCKNKRASKTSFAVIQNLQDSGTLQYLNTWIYDASDHTVHQPLSDDCAEDRVAHKFPLSAPFARHEMPLRIQELLAAWNEREAAPDPLAWELQNFPAPTNRGKSAPHEQSAKSRASRATRISDRNILVPVTDRPDLNTLRPTTRRIKPQARYLASSTTAKVLSTDNGAAKALLGGQRQNTDDCFQGSGTNEGLDSPVEVMCKSADRTDAQPSIAGATRIWPALSAPFVANLQDGQPKGIGASSTPPLFGDPYWQDHQNARTFLNPVIAWVNSNSEVSHEGPTPTGQVQESLNAQDQLISQEAFTLLLDAPQENTSDLSWSALMDAQYAFNSFYPRSLLPSEDETTPDHPLQESLLHELMEHTEGNRRLDSEFVHDDEVSSLLRLRNAGCEGLAETEGFTGVNH